MGIFTLKILSFFIDVDLLCLSINHCFMKGVTFTREELYELVWSEPITKIALRFNLTIWSITAACKEIEVPTPPNGHWQKLKHGKGIPAPALSDDYKGQSSVFIEERPTPPQEILNEYKEQIRNCKNVSVQVPHRLTYPDKLIEAAYEGLEGSAKNQRDKNVLLYLSSQNLNIKVGRPSIDRACRIFDTIIKALKQRGHKIIIAKKTTEVSVLGHEIEIALREKTKKSTGPHGWTEYIPNGILMFEIGPRYQFQKFKDGPTPLENQVLDILALIERIGQEARIRRIEREKEEAIRWEQERIKEALLEKGKKELEKFKQLINDAKRYEEVKVLRAYIADLEIKAKENSNSELNEYVQWAKSKIDWYDPSVNAPDEALSRFNRDSLKLEIPFLL